MRTVSYSARFAVVLTLVPLLYWSMSTLFHQEVQFPELLTLLFTAACAVCLGKVIEWTSPVIGKIDTKEQERTQKSILERELACSLYYNSPLVIVGIREKKRLSSHVVSRILRSTDIVTRSANGYLLALLPFSTLEQSTMALERLLRQLPIRDVVATDVSMLRALLESQQTANNDKTREVTPRQLSSICMQAFDEKFTSLQSGDHEPSTPEISYLFQSVRSEALPEPSSFTFSHLEAEAYTEARARATK